MPTTRPSRYPNPPCSTIFMPIANSMASRMTRYPAKTGSGMASTAAKGFGRNAKATKAAPATTPTARAATPVSWVRGTLVVVALPGTVPASPASTLPTPSTAMAPWTARKSTARLLRRHETRWTATALLIVRMAAITATSRNEGRRVQNAAPKPRSSPGAWIRGRSTQGAAATRSRS